MLSSRKLAGCVNVRDFFLYAIIAVIKGGKVAYEEKIAEKLKD